MEQPPPFLLFASTPPVPSFCSFLLLTPTPLNRSLFLADQRDPLHPRLRPLRAVAPRASLSPSECPLLFQGSSALFRSPYGPLIYSPFGPYSPLP